MTGRHTALATLAFGALALAGTASLAQDIAPIPGEDVIVGQWKTRTNAEIRVERCAEAYYCGYIAKAVVPEELYRQHKDAIDAMGGNFTDQNNKDPALRNRPVLGLQIMVVEKRSSTYEGELYNPEDGNIYGGKIEVLDPNKLRVNGCVAFNLICLGEDWVRTVAEVPAVPAPGAAPAN